MDTWFIDHLVCPRDRSGLRQRAGHLVCDSGHVYPVLEGIPVMLVEEAPPTHYACCESLVMAAREEAVARSDEDLDPQDIDDYVQDIIVGTCGNLYRSLSGSLCRYPIPELRLPQGQGEPLLDVGCNWGRWSISAARMGYQPVGIDPSLESILAAKRVARQLDVEVRYVVADGRYLPFAEGSFAIVFSYSVLQHLCRSDVEQSLAEMARVLRPQGLSVVQMPNSSGLHNLWVQARSGFRASGFFGVRYWRPRELQDLFGRTIGPTSLSVDGFFSLNAQASDKDLLPFHYRFVVSCSEMLRSLSMRFAPLAAIADSLYVHSVRRACSEDAVD
jgi:2-polyprenyl-3-methyl-5-hydroxy-6-metoxy-1,4-benzoquinol methylase/uncharacterized protein YbaR (Trm112 family)